jgi:hypothetical protein
MWRVCWDTFFLSRRFGRSHARSAEQAPFPDFFAVAFCLVGTRSQVIARISDVVPSWLQKEAVARGHMQKN